MTATSTIRSAIERVEEERSVVRVERRAFQRFRETVRPMAIVSGRPPDGTTPKSATLADVRRAYEGTVMGTSDYENAYGDDVGDSVAAELSTKLADELQSSGPLTGDLKRRVLAAVRGSERQRETFLDVLERERTSLASAAEELRDVRERLEGVSACTTTRYPLEAVLDAWETLDELEGRCETVVSERQRTFAALRTEGLVLGDPFSLDDYLYGDLDVTHPVLRVAAETVAEIGDKRVGSRSSALHA